MDLDSVNPNSALRPVLSCSLAHCATHFDVLRRARARAFTLGDACRYSSGPQRLKPVIFPPQSTTVDSSTCLIIQSLHSPSLKKVVKNLDRLSDMLCGIIDLSELVRHAHPDKAWVDAANHAYETLCEFMNVLNTHVGLYEVRNDLMAVQLIFDN